MRTRRRSMALWFAIIIGWLASSQLVLSQTTQAVCADQFAWLNNARGQSPCQVAAVLEKQCLPNADVNIPAVSPGKTYLPPNGTLANVCQCNSVLYSLMSACSLCQFGGLNSMGAWLKGCDMSVVVGQYPLPIPDGTEVPKWAYNVALKDGVFDITAAQVIAYQAPASNWLPAWVVPVVLSVVLTTLLIAGLAIILIIRRKRAAKSIDPSAAYRPRPPQTGFSPFRAIRRLVSRKDSDYDKLVEPQGPPRPAGFMNSVRRVQPRRPDTRFDLGATALAEEHPMIQTQTATTVPATTTSPGWGFQPSFFSSFRRPSEQSNRSNFLSLRRPSSPTTPQVELGAPMVLPYTSTSNLDHGPRTRADHGASASTSSLPTGIATLGSGSANASSSFLPISIPSIFSKTPKAIVSSPPPREFDIADDGGTGSDGEVIAREFGSFSVGDDAATVVLDIGSGDEGVGGRSRSRGRGGGRRPSARAHAPTTPVDEYDEIEIDPPLPSSRLISAANTPLPTSSGHIVPRTFASTSSASSTYPVPPVPRIPATFTPQPAPTVPANAIYLTQDLPPDQHDPTSIIPGLPLPRKSSDTIGLSPATLAAPKPPHWDRSRSDIVNDGVERGIKFDPRGIKLWRDQKDGASSIGHATGGNSGSVDQSFSRVERYGSADDGLPGRPSHDLDPSYPGAGLGLPAISTSRISPAPSSSTHSGSRSASSHSRSRSGGGSSSSTRTSPSSPAPLSSISETSVTSSRTSPASPPPLPPSSSLSPKTAASRLAALSRTPGSSTSRTGSLRGPRAPPPPSPRVAGGSLSHSHSRSGSESIGGSDHRSASSSTPSWVGHARTASAAQPSRGPRTGLLSGDG